MKKNILLMLFLLLFEQSFSQDINQKEEEIITNFINCIKHKDKNKLAENVSYPLERAYPIPPIKNKDEFIERYDQIFDHTITNIIIHSTPNNDWSTVGWRGIMLNNGDIWISSDGQLFAINYQSAFEKKMQNNLINTERGELHKSLKEFKKPIHFLTTATHRVRIDEMLNGTYRVAIWKLNQQTIDVPHIIIQNGKYIADGSGGNNFYEFIKDNYKYQCYINVMGDAISVSVYLGNKELFLQKANQIAR